MVKPQTAGICLLLSFACDRYIDHVSCDSPQHVAEAKTCSLHRFTLGTPFWLHRLVLAWSKIASLLAVTKAPPPRPKRKLTKIQQLAASVWETLGKALGIFQVQRNGPQSKTRILSPPKAFHVARSWLISATLSRMRKDTVYFCLSCDEGGPEVGLDHPLVF